MPLVEYMTTEYQYIKNDYNKCNYNLQPGANIPYTTQETGWHYIPNSRWCDFLNQAQWFDLVTNHEQMKVVEVNISVMNLIPMTDQLAIQQTTTFLSFNNTLYALAYDDTCYETTCSLTKNDVLMPLHFREGVQINPIDGTIGQKKYLPTYTHKIPTLGFDATTNLPFKLPGYFWDPFTRATSLMELRPGKNSVNFHWHVSGADEHIKFKLNFASIVPSKNATASTSTQWLNYQETIGRQYNKGQITPNTFAVADGQLGVKRDGNISRTNDLYSWQSSLYAACNGYKYPIRNWFIKMIPIFDSKNSLLKHEAQVCIVKKITVEVEPRKSAVNFPRIDYHFGDVAAMRSDPSANYGTLAMPKADQIGLHMPPR